MWRVAVLRSRRAALLLRSANPAADAAADAAPDFKPKPEPNRLAHHTGAHGRTDALPHHLVPDRHPDQSSDLCKPYVVADHLRAHAVADLGHAHQIALGRTKRGPQLGPDYPVPHPRWRDLVPHGGARDADAHRGAH